MKHQEYLNFTLKLTELYHPIGCKIKMSNYINLASSLNTKTKKIIFEVRFLVTLTFLSCILFATTYECLAEPQRGLRSILQQDPSIQLTTYESGATQLKAPTQIPKIQFLSKNRASESSLSSRSELSSNDEQQSATLVSRSNFANAEATTITTSRTPPIDLKIRSTTPASVDNTWIESILINVESLNLNHNTDREASVDTSHGDENDTDSATSEPVASSSQAPTDSGEDPLEATTLSSSTSEQQQQQQINATQYSIESPSFGTQTDSNANNGTFDIESNSVAAVALIKDEQTIKDDNQILPHHDNITTTPQTPKQSISCEQAYTQCALRKVCAPALKAYNDDCQDLINNRTSQCSAKCLKAMIALRSSEEGDDLVNCDCQSNEYCTQSKQRSQACKPQVELAVNPKTIVSCSTASWICMADQLCSTALEYYYRNCQTLFSQRHCSMRCNNSLSILYRQPKASKLINCHCDGSEEFPCVKYKTYTERLCLNKQSQSMDFIEDDQFSEEDTFNLTNDPETFILGSPSSSSSSSSSLSSFVNNRDSDNDNFNDNSDEDSTMRDKKIVANSQRASAITGGAEESPSSSGYNGIQLVEDNWIHLISGRYFNNLYGQQQKTKRQQKPSQQQQQDSPQQPLRKAKPLKRNMDWIRNRRRSSSSSASVHRPMKSWLQTLLVTTWSIFVYLSPRIVFNRLLLH